MPSAPISTLPRRWASATADIAAIKLASKGSRNSAADLGMPSNSTCSSRCKTQSAGGMSIWSRSRKLSEWSSQTLPRRRLLRSDIIVQASNARNPERGSRSRTRPCQAVPTSGSGTPSFSSVTPLRCRSVQDFHCSKPGSPGRPPRSRSFSAPRQARTRWLSSAKALRTKDTKLPLAASPSSASSSLASRTLACQVFVSSCRTDRALAACWIRPVVPRTRFDWALSAASRNSCWLRRLVCMMATSVSSSSVTRRKHTNSISWRDGLISRVFTGRLAWT
jgi:hypothetical protein